MVIGKAYRNRLDNSTVFVRSISHNDRGGIVTLGVSNKNEGEPQFVITLNAFNTFYVENMVTCEDSGVPAKDSILDITRRMFR
jgi:hypothetical protein